MEIPGPISTFPWTVNLPCGSACSVMRIVDEEKGWGQRRCLPAGRGPLGNDQGC